MDEQVASTRDDGWPPAEPPDALAVLTGASEGGPVVIAVREGTLAWQRRGEAPVEVAHAGVERLSWGPAPGPGGRLALALFVVLAGLIALVPEATPALLLVGIVGVVAYALLRRPRYQVRVRTAEHGLLVVLAPETSLGLVRAVQAHVLGDRGGERRDLGLAGLLVQEVAIALSGRAARENLLGPDDVDPSVLRGAVRLRRRVAWWTLAWGALLPAAPAVLFLDRALLGGTPLTRLLAVLGAAALFLLCSVVGFFVQARLMPLVFGRWMRG